MFIMIVPKVRSFMTTSSRATIKQDGNSSFTQPGHYGQVGRYIKIDHLSTFII